MDTDTYHRNTHIDRYRHRHTEAHRYTERDTRAHTETHRYTQAHTYTYRLRKMTLKEINQLARNHSVGPDSPLDLSVFTAFAYSMLSCSVAL